MNINSIPSSFHTYPPVYEKNGVSSLPFSLPEDKPQGVPCSSKSSKGHNHPLLMGFGAGFPVLSATTSAGTGAIKKTTPAKEISPESPPSSIKNILPSTLIGAEIPGAVGTGIATLSDKAVVMIKDLGDSGENFKKFRTSEDPFPPGTDQPPSRVGMEDIKMSGSSEFTIEGLREIKEKIPKGYNLIVVDLREESHGFLKGEPVSWKADRNWANFGEDLTAIKQDETTRLNQLAEQGNQTAEEEQVCKSLGVGYVRIPVTDHTKPEYRDADQLVDFVKNQPPDAWLHFHCKAGKGRTTTFMTMYDMMKNADKVSFNDIVRRQNLIGGINLLQDKEDGEWKYQIVKDRKEFLYNFYQYCKENKPDGFPQSYTQWAESRYK